MKRISVACSACVHSLDIICPKESHVTEHMNDVLYVTPITDNEPTDSLRINDLVALCLTS